MTQQVKASPILTIDTTGAMDDPAFASVAASMHALDTKQVFGDLSGLHKTAKAIQAMAPIVSAPLIAPQAIEALRLATDANTTKIHDALKALEAVTFKFAKTIDADAIAAMAPRVDETLKGLNFSPMLSASVAEALRSVPRIELGELPPMMTRSLQDALVLSKSPDAMNVARRAVPAPERMSSAKRAELQGYVVGAIVALLQVIAVLFRSERVEVAGVLIALVVYLAAIFRLLDETQ